MDFEYPSRILKKPVWEILADFQCPACLRKLRSHTHVERQTCLSFVTLIHQVRKHNPIHPTNEKKPVSILQKNGSETSCRERGAS